MLMLLGMAAASGVSAQTRPERDRFVLTSDGVRLHMLEAGPPAGHTILFVPGWSMPAWIWEAQIQAFARQYHVVALDPRGQGGSDVPMTGYEPLRRGKDIAESIVQLEPVPVVIVAWSLGVLDTLAYLHTHDDSLVAGLVLVDNSVGEEPAPVMTRPAARPRLHPPYPEVMRQFVRGLFDRPQTSAWLDRLTQASLRTPEAVGRALRAYPLPRSYWREAVYSTDRPLLYVVRPRWAPQAENLARNRPGTETALFTDAGHALFVDEPGRFNALLDSFVRRRVWP
jgi:non-heme chloroperoxidase